MRLEVARSLVTCSGEVIRRYFRQSRLQFSLKDAVSSIVTEADTAAEEAMRKILASRLPEDGILGEEGEIVASRSGYIWVLDPIDGTSSFVRGLPIFGTLIALVDEYQKPLLGICCQPILNEEFVAVAGHSTTLNGKELCSPYAHEKSLTLVDVCVTSTTPYMFASDFELNVAAAFHRTSNKNAFGGDCYSYMMMAGGFTAMPLVILEANMKYYDFCALIPLVQGTGGKISDWSGNPPVPSSTQIVAAPNPWIHEQALKVIAQCH
jgi:inositol-phosphate phosphatase / L-galactose 1-phosphate phosphatase / histidinol-phosphatase